MKRKMLLIVCAVLVWSMMMIGGCAYAQDYPAISLDTDTPVMIENAGDYCYFSFIPEETAYYRFYSISDNDTYGHLYNEDLDELTNDDDSGENSNFQITYELEAGQNYILGTRFLSSDIVGAFSIRIELVEGLISATALQSEFAVEYNGNVQLQVQIKASNATLTYQWMRSVYDVTTSSWTDNELVENADGASYTAENIITNTNYYCTVSDQYGNSNEVCFQIAIENHFNAYAVGDVNISVPVGETTTLQVTAVCDEGELHYQWYGEQADEWGGYGTRPIEGATTDIFTTDAIERYTSYYCDVWDEYHNHICVTYYIEVDNQLTAEAVPSSEIWVTEGETTTLTVLASCLNGELAYQWNGYENTTNTLDTESVDWDMTYSCIVTDIYGNSKAVEFHVNIDRTGDIDATPLTPGETATAEDSEENCYWFSFTPAETAYYRFYTCTDKVYTYGALFGQGLNWLSEDYNNHDGYNCEIDYKLNAGQKYLFQAQYNDGQTGSMPARVELIEGLINCWAAEGNVYTDYNESVTLRVQTEQQNTELTYQWEKTYPAEEELPSVTGDTLIIEHVASYGEYRCTVTDQFGKEIGADFRVYVNNNDLSVEPEGDPNCYLPVGGATTLQVKATGEGNENVQYQWFRNDEYGNRKEIEGATAAALDVTYERFEGEYYCCIATDQYGNRYEISFWLYTVNGFYAGYQYDSEPWVEQGNPVTLSVNAYCSEGSLSYQWYRGEAPDGMIQEGAQSNELTLDCVTADDRGAWFCRVSDDYGNVFDVQFRLRVHAENNLRVTVDGEEVWEKLVPVMPGTVALIAVTATADDISELTYQWKRSVYDADAYGWRESELIDGAEGDSYSAENINWKTKYSCTVSDQYENSWTVDFIVYVEDHLKVRRVGNEYREVHPGETETLKVVATNDEGELTYQWYIETRDEGQRAIDGATADTWSTGEINEYRSYWCCVWDQYGNNETVYYYIEIDNQLTAEAVGSNTIWVQEGETVTLTVTASCLNGEPVYQWSGYENTTDTLVTEPIYGENYYYCYVTDIYGNNRTVEFHIYIDQTGGIAATLLVPGETVTAEISENGYYWFFFTPEDTAYYTIYTCTNEASTYGELLDQSLNWLGDNSYSHDGYNCEITRKLNAEQKYLFRVQYNDGQTGTMPARIELYEGLYSCQAIEDSVYTDSNESARLQVKVEQYHAELTYQWKKTYPAEEELPSVTGDTLTIEHVTSYGEYKCTVTDQYGKQGEASFRVYVNNDDLFVEPEGDTYCYLPLGGTTTFRVKAIGSGSENVQYQWAKSSTYGIIEGATGASLEVTHEHCEEEYYYCIATDQYDNRTTIDFYVYTINSFDAYHNSESELYVEQGNPITMSVYAYCSEGNLSYQWYRGEAPDGTQLEGEQDRELTLDCVTADDRGAWFCRVSDDYGNVFDVQFHLRVHAENNLQATVDGSESSDVCVTVSPGETRTLKVNVTADDMSEITYRWERSVYDAATGGWNIEVIDGATGETYTAEQISVKSDYVCYISDQYENSYEVYFRIVIENHFNAYAVGDTNITVPAGETTTLQVAATCIEGELNYQWYTETDNEGQIAIEGATTDTCTTGEINQYTSYGCRVWDQYGNSDSVWFYIRVENNFSASRIGDSNREVELDSTEILKVMATCDSGELYYQWYSLKYDNNGGYEEKQIPNAVTDTLVSDPIDYFTEYRCSIWDQYGSSENISFYLSVDNQLTVSAANGIDQIWVPEGETAILKVEASCLNGELTYQWDGYYDNTTDTLETEQVWWGSYYYCRVQDIYGNTKDVRFYVNVDRTVEYDSTPITVGEPATAVITEPWQECYFTFIPAETAVYRFYSGTNEQYTEAYLYNQEMDQLTYNACSLDGYNFELVYKLNAGQKYLFQARYNSDQTGSFPVCLELFEGLYRADAAAEEVYADYNGSAILQVQTEQQNAELTYRWKKSYPAEEDLPSVSGNTMTIDHVTSYSEYECVVTDQHGRQKTAFFRVLVNNDLIIEPDGETTRWVLVGGNTVLRVRATGSESDSIRYKWERIDRYGYIEEIEGATEAELEVTHENRNSETYYCNTTDQYGNRKQIVFNVYSVNNFYAYVNGNPDLLIEQGDYAEMEVYAYCDSSELSYQWYRGKTPNGIVINGEQNDILILNNVTVADKGEYYCHISDDQGNEADVCFNLRVQVENNLEATVKGEENVSETYYVSVGEEKTLEVEVTADDMSELSYRWESIAFDIDTQKWGEWEIIEGAVSDTLQTGRIEQPLQYKFVVTDQYDNTDEVYYSIRIQNHLSISCVGSDSKKVTPLEQATLKVQASCDNGTLSYQWYTEQENEYGEIDPMLISGENGDTYTTAPIEHYSRYYCRVQDQYENAEGCWFYVSIDNNFTVRQIGDEDRKVAPGETETLAVEASCSTGTLTYQWYADDDMIPGATASTYTAGPISHYTEYYCRVEDQYGNNTNIGFYLSVDNNFTVNRVGESQRTVAPGETETLAVDASCTTGTLTYEWYECWYDEDGNWNNQMIPGATAAVYTPDEINRNTIFQCDVWDEYDNWRSISFHINIENSFTAYRIGDEDRAIAPNETETLSVGASCTTGTLTYQWYMEDSRIPGATDPSYTAGPINRYTEYYCRVADQYGNYANIWFGLSVDNEFSAVVDGTNSNSTDFAVPFGETATLKVVVSGRDLTGVTYRWYRERFNNEGNYWDNGEMLDEVTDTLVTEEITGKLRYYCELRDRFSNYTYVNFYLSVENPFFVTADGTEGTYKSFTVVPETDVEMKVNVTGGNISDLTFRWTKNEYDPEYDWEYSTIEGATGNTYTARVTKETEYYCYVSDRYGNSKSVEFYVDIDNQFTTNVVGDSNRTVQPNTVETLKVNASCAVGSLTYQWYISEYKAEDDQYHNREIQGAVSATYTTDSIDYYTEYYCQVRDQYGDKVNVRFYISIGNEFMAEPVGSTTRNVLAGREISLEVTGSCDEGPVRYQWYSESDGILEGETGSAYVTEPMTKTSRYYCRVLDQYGNYENIWFTVKVRLDLSDATLLQLDTPVQIAPSGKDYIYFRFIPEQTGTYIFYSEKTQDNSDPWGERVDVQGNMLEESDDEGDGNNFSLVCYLTEGNTYYFGARHYSADEDGSYEVVMTALKGLTGISMEETNIVLTEPGVSVTLRANAEYAGAETELTYSWSMSVYGEEWVDIPGMNSSTYDTEPINAYTQYRCNVEDQYGNSYSAYCDISIDSGLTAEAIGSTWREVFKGSTVTLSVSATNNLGSENLTYEWYNYNTGVWTQGTDTFTTGPITTYTQFRCIVTDPYGSSSHVFFEIEPVALFAEIDGGSPQTVVYNTPVTLHVTAMSENSGELTYQWYRWDAEAGERIILEGATGTTYTTGAVTKSEYYSCDVADADDNMFTAGCYLKISNNFTAKRVGKESRSVPCGEEFTLRVTAQCDEGALQYRWWKSCADENDEWHEKLIDGAVTDTLVVSRMTTYNADYGCVISDQYGSEIEIWFYVYVNGGNHTAVIIPGREATCTESGLTEGSYCQYCGTTITSQEWIPANGHSWTRVAYVHTDDYQTVTASRHCTECGEEQTETVGLTGVKISEQDCETPERMTFTSDPFTNSAFVVQTYRNVETKPATGHSWKTPVYEWANDYSTMTATRTCRNNPEHVETETVNTTAVTTEATCLEAGRITYTAEFTNTAFKNKTRTVEDENAPALGHSWGEAAYTLADDYSTVTASRKCGLCGEEETETVALTGRKTRSASCEETEQTTYTSEAFTNEAFDIWSDTVDTKPATGHSWGTPAYTWAEDYKSVTATRTCRNNSAHFETETVQTTYEITGQPSCDEPGEKTYTAIFTNAAFSTQTKKGPGEPATGHAWGEATYTWAEDYSTVTAIHTCTKDPEHTESETVEATATYEEGATCETEGKVIYTSAEFTKEGFEQQTREVPNRPAGHDWGNVTYTWSDDNSTVTATRFCRRCGEKETESVQTISEITQPTCDEPGEITYTAVFSDDAFITQTKKIPGEPATGHEWGEPAYTWNEDHTTMTAVRICLHDDSYEDSETVDSVITRTEPTCEESGQIVYTATFTKEGFEKQTYEETIQATGHDWQIRYAWSEDFSKVTATAICRNDNSHTETETVQTTATTTDPTCTEDGVINYVADFTEHGDLFFEQTKTKGIPATGHVWGEPEYTWANDNSQVTAVRTCVHDESHTDEETVNTTIVTNVKATCDNPGEIEYFATFTNEYFEEQSKKAEVPATGHSWNSPEYIWSEDYSEVTAIRTCRNDTAHKEEETVQTTSEVTRKATCKQKGQTTYTTKAFNNTVFKEQTKTVSNIPLAEHQLSYHEKIDATVTETGREAYWSCDVCDRMFADESAETQIDEPVVIPAVGHDHTLSLTAHAKVDSTCTAEGTEAYWSCDVCNKLFSDENAEKEIDTPVTIAKKAHTLTEHKKVEATCEKTGTEAYWSCSVCNKLFSDAAGTKEIKEPITIAKKAHTLTAHAKVDATCEKAGTEAYWSCDTCGKLFSDEKGTTEISAPVTIAKKAHTLTAHAKVDATCEKAGTEAYWSCDTCGKLFSDEKGTTEISAPVTIAKKSHTLTAHAKVDATCEKAGTEAYWSCDTCGKLFSDEKGTKEIKEPATIAKKDHTLTEHKRVEATCEKAGTEAYWECTVCGKLFSSDTKGTKEIKEPVTIAKKGHTLTAHAKVDATCERAGTEAYWSCDICGKLFSDANGTKEISAPVAITTGHKLTEHAKVDATCTTEGTEAYWSCDTCGKLFSDEKGTTEISAPVTIAKKAHTLTAHAKVDATCEKAGTEAYWSCDVCGKLFSDAAGTTEIKEPVVIAATGHSWGEATYTWSDDNSQVTAKRVCANDDSHVETETVSATYKVTQDATTKKTGTGVYTSGTFTNPAFTQQTKEVTIAKYPTTYKDKSCKYKIKDNLTAVVAGPAKKTVTTITIPDTITVKGKKMKVVGINASAFKGNKKIKTVKIGKNVSSIGKNAFYNCTKLAKVTGMAGVTTIEDGAFQKCTSLTAITLPSKVKKIGKNAFNGDKKLKTITIKTTKLTEKNVGANAFKGIYSKATVKCPKSKLKAYKKFLVKKGVPKKAKITK